MDGETSPETSGTGGASLHAREGCVEGLSEGCGEGGGHTWSGTGGDIEVG